MTLAQNNGEYPVRQWHMWNLTILGISVIITDALVIILITVLLQGSAGVRSLFTQGSQFSSVSQSCPTLCDPMNHSTLGLPVHHQLPEFTQIHVHWVGDAIQPSYPLAPPSPAFNPSQQQGVFQWVNSSHQVAKVLEFQFQHESFQWVFRTDFH